MFNTRRKKESRRRRKEVQRALAPGDSLEPSEASKCRFGCGLQALYKSCPRLSSFSTVAYNVWGAPMVEPYY